jgi:hypothetical protein
LGAAIALFKDFVRDTLYTWHTSNFHVLCPNKILGIGQQRSEMPIADARELAALWGLDPVHPAVSAYQVIVDGIAQDLASSDSRYINPPKPAASADSQPRVDLSLERDDWVRGCCGTAAPRLEPYWGRCPWARLLKQGPGWTAPRTPRLTREPWLVWEPQPWLQARPGTLQVAEGRTPLLVSKGKFYPSHICYPKYV